MPSLNSRARLKRYRVKQGLSVREAAEEIGVSHVTWLGWENGTATPIEAMRRALERWSHGYVMADHWQLGERERELVRLAAKVVPHAEEGSAGTGTEG